MTSGPFVPLRNSSAVRRTMVAALLAASLVLPDRLALGQGGVFGSPHNLSASGGHGKHGVSFSEETRVCVFCHVPHNARQPQLLWSRDLPPDAIYTPYSSTTLKATPAPDRPTGASRLCLSCHDGTIALGQFAGSRVAGSSAMPDDTVPTRNANLTTDLSDDHPISFAYDEATATEAGLVSPGALPPQVRLDRNGELQCTACHDPHNNEFGNFLVVDNRLAGSPLCIACHEPDGWLAAGHNPLAPTSTAPELAPACMNCHYAHSAPSSMRLLHSPLEEDNCYLRCHNGNSQDSPDIRSVFGATLYRHPVDQSAGTHDQAESLPASTFHVECVDCHNPHRATDAGIPLASPPDVNGPLQGVRIDNAGTLATAEFEVCFKCHAGAWASSFQGISAPTPHRVLVESDQAARFDSANPAYHPVIAPRRGAGASLKLELQSSMLRVYCSDCHNSERSTRAGGSGANGPHGSMYPHILMAQYDMPETPSPPNLSPPYAPALYDLCFRCHEESYVMASGSAFATVGRNLHRAHVDTHRIPCFVCHDPHGTALTAGASPANNAHLVNFVLNYTSSLTVPDPLYQSVAPGAGSCTVSCHRNATHTRSYP